MVPDREADLDAVVGALQRRLVLSDPGRVLRYDRLDWLRGLDVSAARDRRELDRRLLHRAPDRELHPGLVPDSLRHERVQAVRRAYEPFVPGLAVLAVFWLILFWMYRQKIFVRI